MQVLGIFSTVKDWATTITDFFNNIKIIFQSSIDFLPKEIIGVLIPALMIICGLFIYRFIR